VNLNEIVVEECEKTEFANLVVDMWRTLSRSSSGRMIFRSSPIQKNNDTNNEGTFLNEVLTQDVFIKKKEMRTS
jgi:hypothetical protein